MHAKFNLTGIFGEPLQLSPLHPFVIKVVAGLVIGEDDESVTQVFQFTAEAFPNGFESEQHASQVAEFVSRQANEYADRLRAMRKYEYVSKIRTQLEGGTNAVPPE